MAQYEIAWPDSTTGTVIDNSHSINQTEVSSWHFKTPAELGAGGGSIGLSEYGGAPIPRIGALNFTAGDLTTVVGPPDQSGAFNGDTNPLCPFVGQSKPGHGGHSNKYTLVPDTDYYFNVRNLTGGETPVVVTFQIHDI